MPAVTEVFDIDIDMMTSQQQRGKTDMQASFGLSTNEKETNARENNVAKIKVVVC